MTDAFHATALKISQWRIKAIVRHTADQPALRREALQLRRQARGAKLGRRLRRKAELGRTGAFRACPAPSRARRWPISSSG